MKTAGPLRAIETTRCRGDAATNPEVRGVRTRAVSTLDPDWPNAAPAMFDALRAVGERMARRGYGAHWYLFGSITRSFAHAKDVDVLVICDDGHTACAVRRELRELSLQLPLHLLLLTCAEEAEVGMVESQACAAIFP